MLDHLRHNFGPTGDASMSTELQQQTDVTDTDIVSAGMIHRQLVKRIYLRTYC